MEPFILDFDLHGKNYVIPVHLHHEHGATFYRATIDDEHTVEYYRQENGMFKSMVDAYIEPDLIRAIATRLMEYLHKPNGHGTSSLP